ncbi:MAG TPA: ATP-binding protein, partial [Candidatus Paceibacterota bacterium]|nr:ATP-binding protein [Candidatus Paceibacterota bacterium]
GGNLKYAEAETFELALNSPAGVVVLAEPPWWTPKRLLTIVGILVIGLASAAIWISLLRRQVETRTRQLHREIREREAAERQRALESERSRIARDLHDDLGSSLTEIGVLASTGQRPAAGEDAPGLFQAIAAKARGLIAALDVIVWAVDPEDNSLQSVADYLSGFAGEYLSRTTIACRFKIPVSFPDMILDGRVRHDLLLTVKETLNNIVRHGLASEVEFRMAVNGSTLEIGIADNGKGFDPATARGGSGLRNLSTRLTNHGGDCRVESIVGKGTTVSIRLPLAPASKTGAMLTD